MKKRTYIWALLPIFSCLSATAQYKVDDFALEDSVAVWYDEVFAGNNPELYEGSFYEVPSRSSQGHSMLGSGQWAEGVVHFKGQRYGGVPMIYDLVNDALVLRNAQFAQEGREFLQINPLHVASFDVQDFYFENYHQDYCPPIGPGFYQVIRRGKTVSLIAKRFKTPLVGTYGLEFDLSIEYFIETNGDFIRIKKKKDILNLYPADKKAIKTFIRANRLLLKEGNDRDFASVISYCDKLETPL